MGKNLPAKNKRRAFTTSTRISCISPGRSIDRKYATSSSSSRRIPSLLSGQRTSVQNVHSETQQLIVPSESNPTRRHKNRGKDVKCDNPKAQHCKPAVLLSEEANNCSQQEYRGGNIRDEKQLNPSVTQNHHFPVSSRRKHGQNRYTRHSREESSGPLVTGLRCGLHRLATRSVTPTRCEGSFHYIGQLARK